VTFLDGARIAETPQRHKNMAILGATHILWGEGSVAPLITRASATAPSHPYLSMGVTSLNWLICHLGYWVASPT